MSRSLAVLLLVTLAVPAFAEDKKPLSRIALGSCVHQDKEQPIWDAIIATKPELFLMLGDNIYADTQDIEVMVAKYNKLAAQPGYKKLRETCPILATWDDHDYGGDDAGAEYPKKKESQDAFLNFFNIPPDDPLRKQEGIYTAKIFGPKGKRVQVILLDTRYHRSPLKKDLKRPRNLGQYIPNTDEDATMLGEAQWKWLEEQLRQPAEVRLLCSSIQVVPEDHGFEKWANMPRERARLFQLLRDTRAEGVIVLSGDRHLAELSVMDAEIGYPLYDLTSSGLNQANKRLRKLEVNRHRLATMDRGNNFGLVRINWDKEDPQISLEIHDEEGDVIIRHKLSLSELQSRPTKVVNRNPAAADADLAAEARKKLNQEWTVTFHVLSTGQSKDMSRVFLNTEKNFRSERNLTIVLETRKLKAELDKAGISDPRKHYLGKKIQVTGKVTLFRDNPQIEVGKLDQIKVVDE